MRLNINYTYKPLYLGIVLLLILGSCKIEDDHGTPKFVAGLGDYISQHGELLTEFSIQSELFVNEAFNELYFIGCESNAGWCDEVSLISLNYTSGEARFIYSFDINNNHVLLPEKQPFGNNVFFFQYLFASNQTKIFLYDPALQEYKSLWTEDGIIDGYQVSINHEYAFYNADYQDFYVAKRDFSGNEEILNVKGEVIYAIPNTNDLVLRDITDYKPFIYNYVSKFTTFKSEYDYYFTKVYSNSSDVFFYSEYGYPSIIDLRTKEVVFQSSEYQYLADFNPHCMKVLFFETVFNESSPYYQLNQIKIQVQDINGEIFDTPVILYDEYIDFAKILNDGQTIIYASMGKIYKTALE